jgi:hypothetical protein
MSDMGVMDEARKMVERALQSITDEAEAKLQQAKESADMGRFAQAAEHQAEYSGLIRARWLIREAARRTMEGR